MVLTFPENCTVDKKLEMLFNYYAVQQPNISDDDKEFIVIALNQPDVVSVTVDTDGAIEIQYDGDEWTNPPEQEYNVQ